MGIFSNLFSKKQVAVELKVLPSKKIGVLGEAEQIANIVSEALNTENYMGMSKELADLPKKQREQYVFEHHKTGWVRVACWCCILSLIVFVYYCVIGVFTAIFSDYYRFLGAVMAVVSLGMIVVDFKFIKRFNSRIKFKKRYDSYFEYLGLKKIEFVRDFAALVNAEQSVVAADFERAITEKLIPQGHLVLNGQVLICSDSVYEEFLANSEPLEHAFSVAIEERYKIRSRGKKRQMMYEMGEQYIVKLTSFKTCIKDRKVHKLIEEIEKSVQKIFSEIDVNEAASKKLIEFTELYLPTIENLLTTYISLCEKKIVVPNQNEARKEIEVSLKVVSDEFNRIIEVLFDEQAQKFIKS